MQTQPKSPLAQVMARQWLTFATTHDPNGPGLPIWPQYDSARNMLSYHDSKASVIADTYRQESMDVLLTSDVLALTGR